MTDYIPEPRIIIGIGAPWPMAPLPNGDCRACGEGIRRGDDLVHCVVCDSSSPGIEARIRAARLGMTARDSAGEADRKARASLRRKARLTLGESDRRRIWNGYRGGLLGASAEPTNLAKVGRDFLVEIGQVPDWSIDIAPPRRRVEGVLESTVIR